MEEALEVRVVPPREAAYFRFGKMVQLKFCLHSGHSEVGEKEEGAKLG